MARFVVVFRKDGTEDKKFFDVHDTPKVNVAVHMASVEVAGPEAQITKVMLASERYR
jgi:hypothetical protein